VFEQKGHTHLPASCFTENFGFLPNDYFQFFLAKQRTPFRFPTSSVLRVYVAPFDFSGCDQIIYYTKKEESDASGKIRPAEKTPSFITPTLFTAMMRHLEGSHMTCESLTENGLLLDHFGIVVA